VIPERSRLPGMFATSLLAAFVCFWTFWSCSELYYEGWNTPFPQPLAYLLPAALACALGVVTLAWPVVMGGGIIVLSIGFYGWAMTMNLQRWGFSWGLVISWGAMAATTLIGGALFIIDGRARRQRPAADGPGLPFWKRRARWLVVIGLPAVVAIVVSAIHLPGILTRYDDGQRGARLIEAPGVRLVWAPAGPGWNWRQPWGGYPSWDSLAFYGAPPVGLKTAKQTGTRHATAADMATSGLCAYLDAAGTALAPTPQHLWRMPTADEFVRSLNSNGVNAGCRWNGERGRASCRTTPEKETPLWAPDAQPIYMWTSEQSPDVAWYVNYEGFVSWQPKGFGNPRHGYRCVKDAPTTGPS
jgi:hypothetical protein